MSGSDKTVKVTLTAVATPYIKGVNQASQETEKLGRSMDTTGQKSSKMGSAFGGASTALKGMVVGASALAGTAIVGFLSDSVRAASDLQQSIGGVEAVFGETAGQIKEFGKTSAESVGLSTNAFYELVTVSGALLKNQGIKDYTNQALNLVQVGADLAAVYGGSAKDAIDALNAAMRGESDPIERYGVSLNETAVNAELAARGQSKLTGAALTQAKAQARLNIIMKQTADAQGQWSAQTNTLAEQQQILSAKWENAKAELGGALLPAMTKFVGLLATGVDSTVAFAHAFGAIPAPVKAAAAALVALALAKKGFASASETRVVKDLAAAIGLAGESARAAGGGFRGAAAGVGAFTKVMTPAGGMTGALKGAASGLLGVLGGPWGLALTGATLAVTGWMQAQENARRAAKALSETLDQQTGAFTENTAKQMLEQLQADFDPQDYAKISDSLDAAGTSMADLIAAYQQGGSAVDDFKERFDAWQAAANKGNLGQDAQTFATSLGNAYAAAGRDMDRARETFDVTRKTQDKLAASTDDATESTKSQGSASQSTEDYVRGLRDEAKKATDAQTKLADATKKAAQAALDAAGAALSQDEATSRLEAAVDDATDSVKKNGATLSQNTAAGRANRDALRSIASAAIEQAKANLKAGQSTESTKQAMGRARDEFIRAAASMGVSKSRAEQMADKFGLAKRTVDNLTQTMKGLPTSKTVSVYANTSSASSAIARLVGQINGMPRSRTIMVQTKMSQVFDAQARAAGGPLSRFDSGGSVHGPGTSTSDDIHAMLSEGEFVMRAKAVRKYGLDFMHQINQMRFADGGYAARAASAAHPAAALSLAGVEMRGTLDTPWGPAQVRGIVRDEIGSQVRSIGRGVR